MPGRRGAYHPAQEHPPAEAKPGSPHVVRIRTDTFLRREKCPRCRVRGCVSPCGRKRNDNAACGGDGPGEALFAKLPFPLPGRRGAGQFCAKWPRPCPPPHAAFRTRCTRTVQRVRSEAHYAAAAPRPARRASCGSAGQNRPKRRPAPPVGICAKICYNGTMIPPGPGGPGRAFGQRPHASPLPRFWAGPKTTPPPRLRAAAQRRI